MFPIGNASLIIANSAIGFIVTTGSSPVAGELMRSEQTETRCSLVHQVLGLPCPEMEQSLKALGDGLSATKSSFGHGEDSPLLRVSAKSA
jgi:hypothetical protein